MIEICESVRLFFTLFALTLMSKAARVDDSSSSRRSSSIVSPASSRSTSDTLVFISSISLRISRSSCSMLSSAAVSFRLRAGANRCSTLPYGIHGYYLLRGEEREGGLSLSGAGPSGRRGSFVFFFLFQLCTSARDSYFNASFGYHLLPRMPRRLLLTRSLR
uniref:Putative secreted protein n=1 Tax=Anopheles darlingi TaxID=43151 RepID=A0A2M4DJJ4_ANODA